MSIIHDSRVDCYSVMTEMPVFQFLSMVTTAYENRGGIEGQRAPLKTKTGISIRTRLIDDLASGAVIPPVVVGILSDDDLIGHIGKSTEGNALLGELLKADADSLSIIDGMQRTTALRDAVIKNTELNNSLMRVEFWISKNLNSLIYRMLVLNTGQVPWEISRQLETVYSQLLKIIDKALGEDAEIFTLKDARRRSDAGQYQASAIIRLFLAFSSRKPEFDLKDKVAEDFARMDAIEASSHEAFLGYFIRTLRLAAQLDRMFSRSSPAEAKSSDRIGDGKELFQSFPALVGFFVAVAINIFDEPGFDVDWSDADTKLTAIENSLGGLLATTESFTASEMDEYLQLETLNTRLAQRAGQVGRFERDFFVRAFTFMIEKADRLTDLLPVWRA